MEITYINALLQETAPQDTFTLNNIHQVINLFDKIRTVYPNFIQRRTFLTTLKDDILRGYFLHFEDPNTQEFVTASCLLVRESTEDHRKMRIEVLNSMDLLYPLIKYDLYPYLHTSSVIDVLLRVPVTHMTYVPSKNLLISALNINISVFKNGLRVYKIPYHHHINHLLFVQPDKLFVCNLRNQGIYNIDTGEVVHALPDSEYDIMCVIVEKTHIIYGLDNGHIKVIDSESGAVIQDLYEHSVEINCVAVNGEHIISGSTDGVIKIWDPAPRELYRHTQCITFIHSHENIIISGSYDGSIKIYNCLFNSIKTIREEAFPIQIVAIHDTYVVRFIGHFIVFNQQGEILYRKNESLIQDMCYFFGRLLFHSRTHMCIWNIETQRIECQRYIVIRALAVMLDGKIAVGDDTEGKISILG